MIYFITIPKVGILHQSAKKNVSSCHIVSILLYLDCCCRIFFLSLLFRKSQSYLTWIAAPLEKGMNMVSGYQIA